MCIRDSGTISTVFFIAGGALVVGGVALWATAPDHGSHVAIVPSASPDGAGLAMLGRF